MFVTCIDGQANYNQCPAKLVFDEKSGVCAWPENVNRVGCVREEGPFSSQLTFFLSLFFIIFINHELILIYFLKLVIFYDDK